MSLLKPRTITPALLAANRANGRKSKGPRTFRGKLRSSLNALRHGGRARRWPLALPQPDGDMQDCLALLETLRCALLTADNEAGRTLLGEIVADVWERKRRLEQWVSSLEPDDVWMTAWRLAPLPSFWRWQFKREEASWPEWRVTVSLSLRRGPPKVSRLRATNEGWEQAQQLLGVPSLKTILRVTCTGHPWGSGWRNCRTDETGIIQKIEDTKTSRNEVQKCPKANEPVKLLKTSMIARI